jgi:hypothetical protein
METISNLWQKDKVYEGDVLMDVWMYCPNCGVRQWFKYKEGNIYVCTGTCKKELEVKA